MKFRKDFVTNSSSSSYICDICGDTESGWDLSLSETGMFQCENEHTFHKGCQENEFDELKMLLHIVDNRIKEAQEKNDSEDFELYLKMRSHFENESEEDFEMDGYEYDVHSILYDYFEIRCSFPSSLCPICNLEHIDDNVVSRYLLLKTGEGLEDIKKEIRTKFANLHEFKKLIKEIK